MSIRVKMFVYGFEINRIEAFRYWIGKMYGEEESRPLKQLEIQRRWEKVWGSAGNEEDDNLVIMDVIPGVWTETVRGLSIFAEEGRVVFGIELRSIAEKCIDIERYGRIYHGIFSAIGTSEESRILMTKTPMLYILTKVKGGAGGSGRGEGEAGGDLGDATGF
jgi:hypothetical protein